MALNSSSDSSNLLFRCTVSTSGTFIITTLTAARLSLLLPLSIFVVYLGYRRRQRFVSHSDVFTYNIEVMQLINTAGWIALCCGAYMHLSKMITASHYLLFSVFPGGTLFHVLTCGERYLAVVHPVTYLELRQGGGVRIRNISVASVWLLTFGWSGVVAFTYPSIPSISLSLFLVSALAVVTFCSIAVLRVLNRPGPREGGGARERVDQSKLRAFHSVLAITGTLWVFFAAFLASTILTFSTVGDAVLCAMLLSANWFSLPSSFVLPLLFLQRAGKLTFQCFRGTQK